MSYTTEPISDITRERLMKVGTANVTNALLKRGFRNVYLLGLAPLDPAQGQLVGPAYTVRAIPVREDLRDDLAAGAPGDLFHEGAVRHEREEDYRH